MFAVQVQSDWHCPLQFLPRESFNIPKDLFDNSPLTFSSSKDGTANPYDFCREKLQTLQGFRSVILRFVTTTNPVYFLGQMPTAQIGQTASCIFCSFECGTAALPSSSFYSAHAWRRNTALLWKLSTTIFWRVFSTNVGVITNENAIYPRFYPPLSHKEFI